MTTGGRCHSGSEWFLSQGHISNDCHRLHAFPINRSNSAAGTAEVDRSHQEPLVAEEYLADHFPGFPVLPGVLMIEALTQAGAWLMKASEDFAYSTVMLQQAKAVKFNHFVSPGKALAVTLDVVSWVDGQCTLKGTGTVDGLSAVSARLVLKRFNLAEANPAMAKADALAIDAAKMSSDRFGSPQAEHPRPFSGGVVTANMDREIRRMRRRSGPLNEHTPRRGWGNERRYG